MTAGQSRGKARRPRWARWVMGLVLIVASLYWVLTSVDLKEVAGMLNSADRWMLLVEMPALVLLVWLLRALRWHLVLSALGARPSFCATYFSTSVSLGLAAVTPMQSGELLKIAHAGDQHGLSVSSGAGGYAVERLADVVVLIVMTVTASLALLLPGSGITIMAAGVVLAGLGLGTVAFVVVRRLAPGLIEELARAARILLVRPPLQIAVWTLTLGCWILTAGLWQITLHAVGVDATYALSAFLVGSVTLAGVALLVPGAIGVSEATVTAILIQQGFGAEEGLTAALALRVITFAAIALGTAHWALQKSLPWATR